MIDNIKQLVKALFSNKDEEGGDRERTKIVVKSSGISFVVKIFTILIGIVTMPIVYNGLDIYQFGVYVTLTSIITWVDLFDFGINEGLRNRLTEAKTDGNLKLTRQYISTSYCLLFLIAVALFAFYCVFKHFINWQTILNAKVLDRDTLDTMAFIVLSFFLIRLAASIIYKVYAAFQKSYLGDVIQLIGKFLYLVIVIVMAKTDNLTLKNVAVVQSGISAVIPIGAAFFFFIFSERSYSPSIKLIDFKISGQILGLGWQFFVIQLALLVIHSGNNLLISQFVDPANVSAYSLSYQLFSYVLFAYTIIITPLWSAYTEAWRLGRIDWIKKTMKRIKTIYFIFAIGCFVVVILSPFIFRIWIGEKADVPMIMSFAVAVMVLLDMWIRIYDYFINGVGKIRMQMLVNCSMACVNIPLAYLFSVVWGMGSIGVVLASIISYGISAIVSPIQAKKIINNTARGIWNK